MKKKVFALALLCAVWCHGQEMKTQKCCKEGPMKRGGCANGDPFVLNCTQKFLLREYIVKKDGISTKDSPSYVFATTPSEFCVGQLEVNRTGVADAAREDVALVCFSAAIEDAGPEINIKIYGALLVVSVVFLALTLWVYFLLPQLRDLQGKCVMCQSGCLALAFLNLSIMQLAGNDGSNFLTAKCSVNSFMMYFWFIAMFFWSNVVAINILRSISQSKHLKKTESRQFTYYSAYAWGSSFLFLVATLIAENVEGSHLKPNFGGAANACWFTGVIETWVFFYGPVAVLIVMNIVLFLLSSRLLWRESRRHESDTLDALRYRFSLYLKIFIVTGVTWIFEVAGFAHSDKYLIIWRIADVFNCMQGVAFFLLLIMFRRRALKGLEDMGFKCCGLIPALLKCFNRDVENDPIVGSEDSEHEHVEAPYNVNLN